MFSDHSIVEDDGEEYDDLGEDFKAQILNRDVQAEQEQSTTQEESGKVPFCGFSLHDLLSQLLLSKVHHR